MSEDHWSADLAPIMWKWLVRLIWFGSIAFFQFAEIARYLSGNTYRPFFGLNARLPFAPGLRVPPRGARCPAPGGQIGPPGRGGATCETRHYIICGPHSFAQSVPFDYIGRHWPITCGFARGFDPLLGPHQIQCHVQIAALLRCGRKGPKHRNQSKIG